MIIDKVEIAADINVLGKRAASFPDGIPEAFQQLTKKLSNGGARRIYGISWGGPGGSITYMAAAEQLHDDEAAQTGLESFIVRKGMYLCVQVKDFMNDTSQIGETFKVLLRHPALDTNSYCLELYQGNDVLCMVKTDPAKMQAPGVNEN